MKKSIFLVNSKILCGLWGLLEKGNEVYINGPGLMTKMVATPIYGKNL